MRDSSTGQPRVHLIGHANPLGKDVRRFRFADTDAYLHFIRQYLPKPLRLTANKRLFEAQENQQRGGRRDDAARVRDIQNALDDPQTIAIVAAAGGAYFSRIIGELDFTPLKKRKAPLWALGFSEMTSLVSLVASYPAGRGLYWLCPNYLGWKIKPLARARAAFAEFWQNLPLVLNGGKPAAAVELPYGPIEGRLVRGTLGSGPVRLVGGCLSVLAGILSAPMARRLRPDNRWVFLEDVSEQPYRIDRHLATLKLGGWFERAAGVLVGDFHQEKEDQTAAVVELLRYHLPPKRNVPIVTTRSFGHVWPMIPVPVNRRVALQVSGRIVQIG